MRLPFGRALARHPQLGAVVVSLALLATTSCGRGMRSPGLSSSSQELQALGTAENFAVLGGQSVTNTGPTVASGDLGVSPGTSVTGFPPGLVIGGTIHAGDATALQAQSDDRAAYLTLAGETCGQDLTTTADLAGLTLTPGVYCFSSSALLSGTLTLDAQGNPDALFVFQIGSTLTTASNARVLLLGGARGCDVFWQVGSSATLGTTTTFVGNILALTSIALDTGASLDGRALAQNGSVTLDANQISFGSCAAATDGGTGGSGGGDGGVCKGTQCACGCVDLTSDAKNCGACGHECVGGDICAAGSCAPACNGTQALCAGACVDPLTDSRNCGECGNVCAPDAPCSAGYCGVCPGAVCGSWCVDLASDRNNCGRCSDACAANETCSAGACAPCGATVCGAACVSLLTDPANCGSCGNACAPNQTCAGGACGKGCGGPS